MPLAQLLIYGCGQLTHSKHHVAGCQQQRSAWQQPFSGEQPCDETITVQHCRSIILRLYQRHKCIFAPRGTSAALIASKARAVD